MSSSANAIGQWRTPVFVTTTSQTEQIAAPKAPISLKSLNEALKNQPWPHTKAHSCHELDLVICASYEQNRISDKRRLDLSNVKRRVEEELKKHFGEMNFRLDAFGSSENGFGSNGSDLDMCFRYTDNLEIGQKRCQRETIIDIEKALKNSEFKRVKSILFAKVSIVKFAVWKPSGIIEVDISYNNEMALHNTRLLKRYCTWTKNDVLSKLGMFIKRWAKQCGIGDASKGSLSSYAYIIMLIHFLQRIKPHPLLPVLQEMGEKTKIHVDGWDEDLYDDESQIGEKREIKVDGWDVYFCDAMPKPDWSQCKLSVGELFLKFLDFYAKFDWTNQVVQISQFDTLTKRRRGWKDEMCIQDPFVRNHNLGSGVSKSMLGFIKNAFETCREVFRTLEKKTEVVKKDQLSDCYILKYGSHLLAKCSKLIGDAPSLPAQKCFTCSRAGLVSSTCPYLNFLDVES